MNPLRKSVTRHLSGRKVLWLFILTNLIYLVMLTITIPRTMVFSKGMKLLDMMPQGYNSDYIRKLFNTLGEEGRRRYLFNQIPVDMIYPCLFAISYCLLFAYVLKKLKKLNTPFFYVSLLPIIAGIADYLENFGIIALLHNFPILSPASMTVTSLFSTIKSIATTLFFMLLILSLMVLGIKMLKEKIQEPTV